MLLPDMLLSVHFMANPPTCCDHMSCPFHGFPPRSAHLVLPLPQHCPPPHLEPSSPEHPANDQLQKQTRPHLIHPPPAPPLNLRSPAHPIHPTLSLRRHYARTPRIRHFPFRPLHPLLPRRETRRLPHRGRSARVFGRGRHGQRDGKGICDGEGDGGAGGALLRLWGQRGG